MALREKLEIEETCRSCARSFEVTLTRSKPESIVACACGSFYSVSVQHPFPKYTQSRCYIDICRFSERPKPRLVTGG